MIVIYLSPQGVEDIILTGQSEKEEDACLGIWPLVRRRLKQLDFELRAAAERVLREDTKTEASGNPGG